ncbi:hypothetical protein [Deinococcus sedimenti]|nr:hypothetical protein [Deinococcus sedimenti]
MNFDLFFDIVRLIIHSLLTGTPMSPELFAFALLLLVPTAILGYWAFIALQDACVWVFGWVRRRLDAFLAARGY